jgi:hypothetical protein
MHGQRKKINSLLYNFLQPPLPSSLLLLNTLLLISLFSDAFNNSIWQYLALLHSYIHMAAVSASTLNDILNNRLTHFFSTLVRRCRSLRLTVTLYHAETQNVHDCELHNYTLSVYEPTSLHKSYPCNRPWRPIGLWDVEGLTLSRQSAQRWR